MDGAWYEREYFQLHPGRRRYLEFLVATLQDAGLSPEARVLDIGSGTGLFLSALSANRSTATGLELSLDAASISRRSDGSRLVICADAGRPWPVSSGRFDCVTAFDIIEHVTDAAAMLSEARRALRPGGLLAVITLNAGSIARPLLGRRWAYYQDPTHVRLFSAAALRECCESAGFKVTRLSTFMNFCTAGESAPMLRPLRAFRRVVRLPFAGDSLLLLATA